MVEQRHKSLTQFVAVATSCFVDHVKEAEDLPEAWLPYQSWWGRLTKNDTIISFNYDRVVEELQRRAPEIKAAVLKLHGTVPENLAELVEQDRGIDEIGMPGPSKLQGTRGRLKSTWDVAGEALQKAGRVVVVGYSFPPGDSFARSFIVRNLKTGSPGNVDIVLGTDPAASNLEAMFKRLFIHVTVRNTNLLAQQHLVEGTADPAQARFEHQD